MRGSLVGLQQCSSRCQKEAKTVERLLKWRRVLMEDSAENGGEGDIEEDEKEGGAASRGAASRNCRRFEGVNVVLPNTCRKPKFGTTKRGGRYGPVEKANIARHFKWYLKNLKLPPI